MKKIFITLAIAISLFHSVDARVRGRVEAAPLYLHIGVVQSGQTTQRIDMYGGRLDATILPFEGYGVCLKPFGFGGWGNGSDIYSYGLGLGHYTPISDRITLIPVVGVSRTHMETQLDVPALALYNLSQRFRSYSFYVGGEAVYKLTPCFYVTGIYQYGWANTKTLIDTPSPFEAFVPRVSRGESQGSNFAFVFDYYFKECISASLGIGYNNSLSKERHGIKGYGIKLGAAYTF